MKNTEHNRTTGFPIEEGTRIDGNTGEILGFPPMTYGQLLEALQGLTLQQLDQPVAFWGETKQGHIKALEVLHDDFIYDGYDGYWPKTDYCQDLTPEELADAEQEHIIPKGTVKLEVLED